MNLWLYGLQEEEGENVKRRVIDICRNVVPGAAYIFPLHIDTVQRIGKKGEGKVRPGHHQVYSEINQGASVENF